MKNYKITRHDGTIQYATKHENCNEYFLNGFGFGIIQFDALLIEETDSIPTKFVEGIVYYDENGTNMKALCDLNRTFNGWAMPYIHETSIKKFIKLTSWESHVYTLLPNGDLHTLDSMDSEIYEETIKPEIINGQKYYYLGNEGICFEFKAKKN